MERAYKKLLKEYIDFFPCTAIISPRQCGKTTFLESLPRGWKLFDLEKQSDFQIITQDIDLFLHLNPEKVAIDEAQMLPELLTVSGSACGN